jgi:hypothetical protein
MQPLTNKTVPCLGLSAGKIAIVKPLHKKGDPGDIQNYRPISLLSVFLKDFRKINV